MVSFCHEFLIAFVIQGKDLFDPIPFIGTNFVTKVFKLSVKPTIVRPFKFYIPFIQ
jgi:hypothetical protein